MAARTKPDTIQVVVHVLYHDPAANIGDAQIRSQLKVLNSDFRANNADRSKTPDVWKGLVAGSMIEFALARKGPDGKPSTGITRTQTRSRLRLLRQNEGGGDGWSGPLAH